MRNYCYKKGTYSLSPRAGRTAGEGIIAHRREHAVLEKEEWLEEELLLTVKHSLNDVQSPRPLLFTGATVHLRPTVYIFLDPYLLTLTHLSPFLIYPDCSILYSVQYVHCTPRPLIYSTPLSPFLTFTYYILPTPSPYIYSTTLLLLSIICSYSPIFL